MAVKRLQRGASLELLSRELKVTTAGLEDWRDRVAGAAETELKDQTRACDDQFPHRRGKVGEITMENKLLC